VASERLARDSGVRCKRNSHFGCVDEHERDCEDEREEETDHCLRGDILVLLSLSK
jgi:hypothetical protein